VSLFRIVKYSSLIYFLGRHRNKLFRSAAVLLFAFVTSLLYEDIRAYLEIQHPGTLIYALVAKIVIVYGSLLFVLWQFRPQGERKAPTQNAPGQDRGKRGKGQAGNGEAEATEAPRSPPDDRLQALADIDRHDRLRSRYDRVLAGQPPPRGAGKNKHEA
jgi:hypothetical protein